MPKSQTSFMNLKTCSTSAKVRIHRLFETKKYHHQAGLLPPLLQHTAYTVFLLHLVLFLIRKGKLPKGSCIRDKALSMSGPNEDSTFWFLK